MIDGVEVLTSEMVRTSPESDALIFVGGSPFYQRERKRIKMKFYWVDFNRKSTFQNLFLLKKLRKYSKQEKK